jgi:hypothetical protein
LNYHSTHKIRKGTHNQQKKTKELIKIGKAKINELNSTTKRLVSEKTK